MLVSVLMFVLMLILLFCLPPRALPCRPLSPPRHQPPRQITLQQNHDPSPPRRPAKVTKPTDAGTIAMIHAGSDQFMRSGPAQSPPRPLPGPLPVVLGVVVVVLVVVVVAVVLVVVVVVVVLVVLVVVRPLPAPSRLPPTTLCDEVDWLCAGCLRTGPATPPR